MTWLMDSGESPRAVLYAWQNSLVTRLISGWICGVGAAEPEEDDEPFEQKMARLTKELKAQFEESAEIETAIRANLQKLRG